MSAVNEALIRDVVTEVLGRLGQSPAPKPAASPAPPTPPCACTHDGPAAKTGSAKGRGKFGVFQDANDACAAAQEGFLQLKAKGVAARARVVELVKTIADSKAIEWGKLELE